MPSKKAQGHEEQRHADPASASGVAHYSASSGQSVVAFLSNVTKSAQPAAGGGALDYLNQQSKRKGGKPQPTRVEARPAPSHPADPGKTPAVITRLLQQIQGRPEGAKTSAESHGERIKKSGDGDDVEPSSRPRPSRSNRHPPAPTPPTPSQEPQRNVAAPVLQVSDVKPPDAVEPAESAALDPAQLAMRKTYDTFVAAVAQQEARPDILPTLDVASLLEVIAAHQVTMVCTDTGTGKSSSLPLALLAADPMNKIVSSQPRRTATLSIASHVAAQRGERVGDSVGYWIRGAKAGDTNTRLWYLTSYTLLLQLLAHPEIPYTHVILDEFHERQPDLEVTMALLRLALRRGANFKLILVSATLNFEDWARYLDGLNVALFQQSEVEHRIWEFSGELFCPLLGLTPPMPSQLEFADSSYIDNALFVSQYLIAFINQHSKPHQAILIFVPGRAQVEQLASWVTAVMHRVITPVPWHSSVDLSVIQAAIRRPAGGKQKLYIATDIAEVSITIPDLVFLIDLGLVKRPQINTGLKASIMFPPLSTQFVSQSSLAQRRGRVGRLQQGFYFCTLPASVMAQLPLHSAAPIQNSRIDELALHVLQVVENPIALFGLCCAQPPIEAILMSMRTLTDAGCIVPRKIDEFSPDGPDEDIHAIRSAWNAPIMTDAAALVDEGVQIDRYRPTFVGKLAQVLPVSVSQAMIIFYGFLTGLESLMILAGACANLPIPFVVNVPSVLPFDGGRGGRGRGRGGGESIGRAMELTELSMKEHGVDSRSDIIAAMGVAVAFRLEVARGASENELNDWCRRQSVTRERIQAIIDLEEHIKFELGAFIPFRDVDDPRVLQQQIAQLQPVIRAMICTAFAAQALEVTAEGSMQFKVREGASGIFNDLAAVPDLHSPSCIRWAVGEVVIPVTLTLRHGQFLLGSYTTAVEGLKFFYLSCVLFAHSLQYEIFEDDNGQYYEFLLTFHGRSRVLECNSETGKAIISFRNHLRSISGELATLHEQHVDSGEGMAREDVDLRISRHEASVLAMQNRQSFVVTALQGFFFGSGSEQIQIEEIQPGDETIERRSTLTV